MEEMVAEYAFPYAVSEVAANATLAIGATVPSWTTIPFPVVDYENVGSPAIIERPTSSQFQVKFKGQYLIHYDILASGGANNVGWQVRATLNGNEIPQSISYGNSRTSVAECRTVASSFLIELQANDIIEIQGGVRENASITVQPGSSAAIELRRMT